MILSLLLLAASARADEEDDDPISAHRVPFTELVERAIGSTSTPVAFDWRRTKVQLGATGDHLFELNNFNSLRAGGVARIPTNNVMFELGLSYVWVWDSPSSRLLALTPYRQPGRPDRLELDAVVGVPLAEGVVTAWPRFFPATQLVFSGYVGLRYLIYPGSYEGLRFREVVGALASPAMTETELDNLEDRRLDAMAIDTGRYGVMVGFGNDIYFKQGLFIAPRVMMALPILAPASGTEMLFWSDISLSVGISL